MARWVDDIIQAFENLGGTAEYSELYDEVREVREEPLPKTWKAIVRNRVETHSSDSENFDGNDLFYSVDGIGSGTWGLRNFTPRAADLEASMDDADAGSSSPDRIEQSVYRVLRDTQLARRIKSWHGNHCQICGERLSISDGSFYSEAHHIKPLGRGGPDVAENIICVCPNHHALLDYGAIRLKKSKLRQMSKHSIEEKFIRYHNSAIFDSGEHSTNG